MSDEVTVLLDRATPSTVEALDYDELVRRGHRRRRVKRATAVMAGGVATIAVAVGLASSLPTTQPEIDPVATAPASPSPSIVQSTDGTAPVLPIDAEPLGLDTRALTGMDPDVGEAAVASDGRVAVSGPGGELAVAHPDDAAPTPMSVPDGMERCGSMAFDASGDLWVFCDAGGGEDVLEAALLRFGPGQVEPETYDVTEQVRAASPTALYAPLWIDGEAVRAVVPTDAPSESDGLPTVRNASVVTLVADGGLQGVDDTAIRELPPLELDAGTSVSASAGRRIVKQTTPAGRQWQISWLTHEATAVIDTPAGDWHYRSTRPSSAFVGSTTVLTYELSSTDRTLLYGLVADGQGTTSVMRLPTTAEGRQDVRGKPDTPIVAMLLPAPDGSVHLLQIGDSSLATAQVLPAAS